MNKEDYKMDKINSQGLRKNVQNTALNKSSEIKKSNNSNIKANSEQLPEDEFVSSNDPLYKYDPEVQAYEYTKSEDGQKLIERMRDMFKK